MISRFKQLFTLLLIVSVVVTPIRFVFADEENQAPTEQTPPADPGQGQPEGEGNEQPPAEDPEDQPTDSNQENQSPEQTEPITERVPDNNLKKKLAEPDNASGALIYSYPLQTPPGRNGLQPNLSLTYNSQFRDSSSLFGQGWSISIPSIERINKKGVEKMYSEPVFSSSLSDELVLTGTDTYKAKVDNGDFINYTFADSKWTAIDKQGTTYTFGATATSRQDDPQDTTRIFKWMLEEVRDRNDNFVRYEYYKDQGQIYPSKITYTGNGTTDGLFTVDFLREARPDIISSSRSGFVVKSAYRINEVRSSINNNWNKKYSLAYASGDNSKTSLLSSIITQGRDDAGVITSLPATSFEYQKTSSVNHWDFDTTSWTSPEWINERQGGVVGDINGDGLDDLMYSWYRAEGTGQWLRATYINNGNGQFIQNENYSPPFAFTDLAPNGQESDYGVRLVDINGDGLQDIIRGSRAGGNHLSYLNTGNGWAQTFSWETPVSFIYWSGDTSGQIANLNGDNLPDIIGTRIEWINNQDTLVTYAYINTGNGWSRDENWHSPLDLRSENGTMFSDVNGDGLDDIVQSARKPNGTFLKVYISDGKGSWNEAPSFVLPTYFFDIDAQSNVRDRGYRLLDINGDGLPDVVKQGLGAYLNTGTNWSQDNDSNWNWDGPGFPVELGGSWFGSTYPYTAYISNMSGDGMPDIFRNIKYGNEFTTTIVKNKESRVNILKKINYDTGGSTSVTYQSTPLYRSGSSLLNPKLSMIIDTVKTITTADGSGATSVTNYTYEGALYYYDATNPSDSKFAGFAKVTTQDSLTKTISFYHQGNDSDLSHGEYQDHVSKIGKKYREEVRDLNGNLFSKTINTWDRNDLGSGRSFIKLTQTVVSAYGTSGTHNDSAQTFTYDTATGNQMSVQNWGEVSGVDNGGFTDIGSDAYSTTMTYVSSPTAGIYGLPAMQLTIDQNNNKISETRSYYDNLSLGQANKGNLTKQEQWKSGSQYITDHKTYNAYGLVTTEIDPRGKVTTYGYDAYNLYPATVTNAAGHLTSAAYNYVTGNVKQAVDSNGFVFTTVYDGLGRPLEERQPDQSNPSLSTIKAAYQYIDTPNAVRIKQTTYLDSSNNIDSYTYFDGLGRKVQERNEAATAGQFNVRDFAYTDNDLLLKESLPYASSGSAQTSPVTTAALYTTYAYDALKRPISMTTAVGATNTAYSGWKTIITDAKNKQKDIYHDAYGNLVKVVEKNDKINYTTRYDYNGLKKLIKITDAVGNVRNFSYDGLGRAILAEDLHAPADTTFGVWTYAYDNAGNLISKTDAMNQAVEYVYDDINRPLSEDSSTASGIEVTYAYDNCLNGVGRLCSSVNAAVATAKMYDALGNVTNEQKSIDEVDYITNYTFDRQGNPLTIENTDGSMIRYSYNAAGQVNKVERREAGDDYTNVVSSTTYNPAGLPLTVTYANGGVMTNTYDAAELYRLRHRVTVSDNVTIQDLTYTYDPVGNITRIVDASDTNTAKTTDYEYDDLHRLLSATISNAANLTLDALNQTQTFAYDPIGNITSKSDVGAYLYEGDQNDSYANPHAVTSINGEEYTYDRNGNMLTTPDGQRYHWDYSNRLTSVDTPNGTPAYEYDVDGQRAKTTTPEATMYYPTKFYSTDGTTADKHIFMGDVAIATVRGSGKEAIAHSLHTDHLTGSNVATAEDGSIDELTDYYAFGSIRLDEQTGDFKEKRKYTGHEYDAETGLTYANARYYDARIGRWLSEDPIFISLVNSKEIEQTADQYYPKFLFEVQGMNSYSYVKNNPLRYIDITGCDGFDVVQFDQKYNPFTILFKPGFDNIYYGVRNKDYVQASKGAFEVLVNGTILVMSAYEIGLMVGEGYILYRTSQGQMRLIQEEMAQANRVYGRSGNYIPEVSSSSLSKNVRDSLQVYESNGWQPRQGLTTKTYENREGYLPAGQTYKEFDVNPKTGPTRDAERFFRGDTDHSIYYTNTHMDPSKGTIVNKIRPKK